MIVNGDLRIVVPDPYALMSDNPAIRCRAVPVGGMNCRFADGADADYLVENDRQIELSM